MQQFVPGHKRQLIQSRALHRFMKHKPFEIEISDQIHPTEGNLNWMKCLVGLEVYWKLYIRRTKSFCSGSKQI